MSRGCLESQESKCFEHIIFVCPFFIGRMCKKMNCMLPREMENLFCYIKILEVFQFSFSAKYRVNLCVYT